MKWDTRSTVLLQYFGDRGIAVGTICTQCNHVLLGKSISNRCRINGKAFVCFAGDTPIGSKVDEYRMTRVQCRVEGFLAEFLPGNFPPPSKKKIPAYPENHYAPPAA